MAAGRIDRRVKPAIEYTVELCAAVIREADGSKARARLDLRPLGIPFRQEPSGASEGNARQTERAPRDQTDVKKAPRVDHAVGDAELLLELLEPFVEARLHLFPGDALKEVRPQRDEGEGRAPQQERGQPDPTTAAQPSLPTRVTSLSPAPTAVPGSACSSLTTPSPGAPISFCIFMASRIRSGSPSLTS